jgi:hypothetical protein
MTTRRVLLPLFLGLVLAFPTPAPAQCFAAVDDGFDTGCCGPVAPNLPVFPSILTTGDYGALLGCHQTFVIPPFPVFFSAPQFITCDYALINVFVQLTSSETVQGFLAAKYVRTWADFSTPVLGQVYRFLVNGDLSCTSTNTITPCTTILPRCAALNLPVHFDGHIDYACDFTVPGGAVTCSYSLNHIQGCITHASWSAVPLGGIPGHDEMSYHIVGPAPFTFNPAPLPQGSMTSESVRSSYLRMIGGFQYQCRAEARVPNIAGANVLITQTPLTCGCAVIDQCTSAPACPAPVLGCYAEQFIQGLVCCPTPGNTFQGFPLGGTPIANTGFRAQSLGSWSGGFLYPANASLSIYWGVMTYNDPCAVANWNIHAVTGVGVTGTFGQPFNNSSSSCGPPPFMANTFIDLQNCLLLSSAFLPPGYGSLSAADVVWSLDL